MKTLVIILALSVMAVSCSGGRNSTGYSLINDMVHSVAYEAYSENPLYDDAQTNQLAVQGTVARGFLPHPLEADGTPKVLENPHEMTGYAMERGEKLFKATCTACHGVEGLADGLVVSKGGFPAPPSFSARRFKKSRGYSAGDIYNVITFGFGNMPSHAQQLYPEDRWYVAEYVRETLMKR